MLAHCMILCPHMTYYYNISIMITQCLCLVHIIKPIVCGTMLHRNTYNILLIQYFIAVISYCSFYLMAIFLNLLRLFIVLVLFKVSTSDYPPATFVFGDSLVDVGNNNYLVSLSKANYVPNGIDFGRPTGRFTNGRTIVDIIGKIYHLIFMFFCTFIYY